MMLDNIKVKIIFGTMGSGRKKCIKIKIMQFVYFKSTEILLIHDNMTKPIFNCLGS